MATSSVIRHCRPSPKEADRDFAAAEQDLHTNTDLTRLVHQLTTEIHARLIPTPAEPPTDAAHDARRPPSSDSR